MPNLTVIRPSEASETKSAWIAALENKSGPTALLLTRQNLPVFDRTAVAPACSLKKGAYVLWESAKSGHDIVLLASGSEVSLIFEAGKKLAAEGKAVRVISFPSWDLFEKQDAAYKASVIPAECSCRLAVEAGVTLGWEKYVGEKGRVIGLDRFGASGPAGTLAKEFGFTVDNVYNTAKEMLA
jgi:transketolase